MRKKRDAFCEDGLESVRQTVLKMLDEKEVVKLTSEAVRFRSVTSNPMRGKKRPTILPIIGARWGSKSR